MSTFDNASLGDPAPASKRPTAWQISAAFLRARFSGGILLLAPFVLTYMIFRWLYGTASGILEPLVTRLFGHDIPGLSVTALFVLTFVTGWVAINLIGHKILYGLEAGMIRVPVIGPTFSVIKQLISALGPGSGMGFSRVVEVEYPRRGIWAIGFLTGVSEHDDGTKVGLVYLPGAPAPNTGHVAIIPLDDIYHLGMTQTQALSLLVSAGVAAPARIRRDSRLPASHFLKPDPDIPSASTSGAGTPLARR